MENLMATFADAAIALVATAIAGLVWLNLKWLFASKKTMELVLAESRANGRSIRTLFRLYGALLASLKASLEVQRDGKCNGNVTQALDSIGESQRLYDEHLLSMLGHEDEKKERAA